MDINQSPILPNPKTKVAESVAETTENGINEHGDAVDWSISKFPRRKRSRSQHLPSNRPWNSLLKEIKTYGEQSMAQEPLNAEVKEATRSVDDSDWPSIIPKRRRSSSTFKKSLNPWERLQKVGLRIN
jgi:hypothetical protein